MQVTTGGADVTQQTGGVGINLVTRSGTDQHKGNARFLVTDEALEDDNISDTLQAQGAAPARRSTTSAITGSTSGGPVKAGRAWFWGSYATQAITTGVVGFYKEAIRLALT
jgi:hypothetical protein